MSYIFLNLPTGATVWAFERAGQRKCTHLPAAPFLSCPAGLLIRGSAQRQNKRQTP